MTRRAAGVAWSVAYVLLIAAPLIVLGSGLVGLAGSGWWFDFAMGLGFGAMALLGGQFVLTARFRRATAPFGMDVLYVLHRWLAVIAVLLVVAHYLILRMVYPATIAPASPTEAPLHMTAGRAALLAFAVVVASSLWRRSFRLEYDRWRFLHIALAVVGMTLALVHVLGVRYYSGVFWTRALLDLFVASLLAVVAYVRVVKPMLATAHPYRVREVRPERGRTTTLVLEPDGHEGLRFAPGQFAWLSLGASPLKAREHPFSFSGSAERAPRLELTIKQLGDFTATIGDTPVGSVAYLDGPHGVFTVDRYPAAPGFMFVAGGVGIAPIASILRTLADRGDRRPMGLLYGSRLWEETILRDDIQRLTERLDLRVVHVLEEPHPGWDGAVGWPTPERVAHVLTPLPAGVECFLCGPRALGVMAQRALHERGVPLRRIHYELFELA